MATTTLQKETPIAASYIQELEAETASTRKCLERIPDDKFDFKPHPTSMSLGYLSLLVAQIPLWITYMIEKGEVDFASFPQPVIKTNKELIDFFDANIKGVNKALQHATEEQLNREFHLRQDGKSIFSVIVKDYIGPTINHWVHHRGQLTVYKRMCELPVPSIYGPSADDKHY